MRFLWLVATFTVVGVIAVDRSNFKTCEQSGFCRRHRRLLPGQSPFSALTDTAEQKDTTSIELDLVNGHNQQMFSLRLQAIDGPSLRLTIDEKHSAVKRYVASSALRDDIRYIPLKLVTKNSDRLEATFGDNGRVVLYADQFKATVFSGEFEVISVNARGLLKFEHYRHQEPKSESERVEEQKVEDADPSKVSYNERGEKIVDGEAKVNEDPDKDEGYKADINSVNAAGTGEDLDGAWEETFKGHTDTKPRGPMSVGVDITFEGFDFVYGLPEHADSFALKSTKGSTDPYRLYNLDVFEYETSSSMALYGAVPFIMAHGLANTAAGESAGMSAGVLWLNPSETWVDLEPPAPSGAAGVLSSVVDFVTNAGGKGRDAGAAAVDGRSADESHHGASSATRSDRRRETHWFSETGVIDIFFIVGHGPGDVARAYARLTGVTPLPPLFALGYHQCRWNYNDMDDVRAVDAGFDEHNLPYDVLWLDIEHTDGKRYFTWDPVKFARPTEMITNLTAKGRRMVTIIDPHIKRDPNYPLHSEASARGYYVKERTGSSDYDGWCWSGSSSYLDFFSPEVRDYWASQFALDRYKGSTDQLFTWNDMNEPSVFNGPEVTMPKDCQHVNGLEHRDVHNMYGIMQHMATYQGHLLRSGNRLRPFVLTRSFFAGSQRYGAVWTGDNMASWDHLRVTIPMLLSLSVSGITFVGADVGGFFGNPEGELAARWYQMAAYQPFFRGHAHHDSRRREPWLFDADVNAIIRKQLRDRYRLLPLWYTLFFENEHDELASGSQPPMRPVWWDFPTERETFELDDCHLVGNRLLVRPVLEKGATHVQVYFPGKNTVWYDMSTQQKFMGLSKLSVPVTLSSIPVFQRGGSVLFTKERPRRCSALQAHDPYTIIVALDRDGKHANGTVYIDDETSFEYRSGAMVYAVAVYRDHVLSYRVLKNSKTFKTPTWVERIILIGSSRIPTKITEGDKLLEFSHSEQSIIVRKPAFHMDTQWNIVFHFQ